MRITNEQKLRIVKEYFEDKLSITSLAKKHDIDIAKLKYAIRLFEAHGEEPFTDKQQDRIYTREEKIKAIEDVINKKKSCRQVGIEHGLTDPSIVKDWVNLYKRKGFDGIQISRGRKKYLLHEDRQKYLANKELKNRLLYLEAENAYLKKLYSLRLKKNKQSKKK